jgi:hypothetical protein
MRIFHLLAATAAVGALAVPAAAQSSYPYQNYQVEQVPQPYPGQPGYAYGQTYGTGQPGYAYGQQGYAQNPIESIIGQLLGNRYNVSDRQAVSRCASAAMTQASAQYRGYNQGYGNNGYNNGYANNGYAYGGTMRVTAITNVERRSNGLRVSGLMSSGYGGQYGQNAYQQGYQNRGYGDVSFRCNVDYRGAVTNVRIGRNNGYRG